MNKKTNQKLVKAIEIIRGIYFPFTLCLSILLAGLAYAALLAASHLLNFF